MPSSHSNSSSQVAEWVGGKAGMGAEPGGYDSASAATVGEVVQGAEGGAFLPMPKMVKVWQLWHRRRLELG